MQDGGKFLEQGAIRHHSQLLGIPGVGHLDFVWVVKIARGMFGRSGWFLYEFLKSKTILEPVWHAMTYKWGSRGETMHEAVNPNAILRYIEETSTNGIN